MAGLGADLAGCLAEDEVLSGVVLEGTTLTVVFDFSQTDFGLLPEEDLVLSRASGVTDKILEHSELDAAWDTVYLDFGAIGHIELGKSAIKTNDYGMRYMDSTQFQLSK